MTTIALPPTITLSGVTLTFNPANPTTGTPTSNTYYGYCTVAQVQFEFTSNLLAGASGLTTSIIAEEITNAAIELQKLIEAAYVMPYTGSDANILTTLMFLNRWLAFANIYDRYFFSAAPDASPAAALMRNKAELFIKDIIDGNVQWSSPFGDAQPNAMKPQYDISQGAQSTPNPNDIDPNIANPIFSIERSAFRNGDII